MKTSKVALLQTDIIWEDHRGNLERADDLLKALPKGLDLVVFPEMFTSGFSVSNPEAQADFANRTLAWMQAKAVELNAAIVGTSIVSTNSGYVNRMHFVTPSFIEFYDKRHLFSLSDEGEKFVAGKGMTVVEWRGVKYALQICYDLRFPVFSRNTMGYDVLLYSANWPAPRIQAWDTLLSARAIENQCFSIGVNRVGKDVNGYEHPGHSAVYSFMGNKIGEADKGAESTEVVDLPLEDLEVYRQKFPFLEDRDSFTIQ